MKNFKDYIPLITFLLVVGNTIQLNVYYNFFDIDIFNYLDFTELALGFLDEIYYLAIVLTFFMFAFVINDLFNVKKKIVEVDLKKKKNLLVGGFGIVLILLFIYSVASKYFLNHILSLLAIVLIVIIYVLFSEKADEIQRSLKYYALIPVYLLICYFYANFKYYGIIENKVDPKSSIMMNDGEIINTSNDVIFIGQTKSHIFLFNKKNEYTSIIKWQNVEQIDVLKN
jgi:hypothetical protein